MTKFVPFVLQHHKALRAGEHYDLRLRYPFKQKLASWALRYLPNSKEKKLAMPTEDHDMSWMNFSGTIAKGEYGAGEVEIAQKGQAEIVKWTDSAIVFKVEGKIMNGQYSLVKADYIKPGSWLLIKGK